jgi:uncharacterized cupin superfamily protein
VSEARLENVGTGLAPATPGWFVVNANDAAWVENEAFGARCVFESSPRVLAERPDLEPQRFAQLGITLTVVLPGKPTGLYHSESAQEDFLVLGGECIALIDGQERRLRQWDFVHCPPGTPHCFVGAGEEPCTILMLGARFEGQTLFYPRSDLALRHGAGVEEETDSPRDAYAPLPHWRLGRPEWAIVDSNHGPPPYQSGALTD